MTRLTDEQIEALYLRVQSTGELYYVSLSGAHLRALLDERHELQMKNDALVRLERERWEQLERTGAERDALRRRCAELEHDVAAFDTQMRQYYEQKEATERRCERLREALHALSGDRQFGPCWCNTAAGLYCVAQEHCNRARAALAADEKMKAVTCS